MNLSYFGLGNVLEYSAVGLQYRIVVHQLLVEVLSLKTSFFITNENKM